MCVGLQRSLPSPPLLEGHQFAFLRLKLSWCETFPPKAGLCNPERSWRPGWGGIESPKMRGGRVKNSNFRESLIEGWKLTPSYQDFIENPQFGAKGPSFRGATFGASSPPPLAFRTFLNPPPASIWRRPHEPHLQPKTS